ncbi:MAG: hypothetical protein M5F18_05785 [Asgard group archaeon]|nr:hypothetical protein [Asgard group archaeon]
MNFIFSLAFYWENHNHLLSIVQLTTVNSSYGFYLFATLSSSSSSSPPPAMALE